MAYLPITQIFSLFFVYIPVIIYPIKTVFSSNCPTIVIKEAGSSKTSNTPSATPCDLTDDEKAKLDERKLCNYLSVIVSKDRAGATDRGRPISSKFSVFFLYLRR